MAKNRVLAEVPEVNVLGDNDYVLVVAGGEVCKIKVSTLKGILK